MLTLLFDFFVTIFIDASHAMGRQRVAFIRLGGGLGDWVTLTPAIRLLRDRYPSDSYELIAIVDVAWSSLAKTNCLLDQVIAVDRKRFGRKLVYRARTITQIAKLGIHTIYDFALFRRLSLGDSIVRASGAFDRVGFQPQPDQPKEKWIGNLFFSTLVADSKWLIHEIDRNNRLATHGQLKKNINSQNPYLAEVAREKQDQFVVAPGASVAARQWDPRNFAKLAIHVHAHTAWKPILVGTAADKQAIDDVIAASPNLPWKIHLGTLPVVEFVETVQASQLMICNDSGPMHVGPAVATPTLAMVPGAEFTAYSAYPTRNEYLHIVHAKDRSCFNCRWKCIYLWEKGAPAPCVNNISLEFALTRIDLIIG